MTTKLSAGPWTLSRNGKSVMSADGNRVADCRDSDVDDAQQEANAKAISAVREMIAALESAASELKASRHTDEPGSILRQVVDALAKAK